MSNITYYLGTKHNKDCPFIKKIINGDSNANEELALSMQKNLLKLKCKYCVLEDE